MIASSISGSCATVAGHPADSLKVRMQMTEGQNKSIIRTMYTILRQEGIMPFYRGVIPPSAIKAFTTMVFFTTNNYLKDSLIINKRNKYIAQNEPVPDKIILSLWETSAVAGFCGFMLFPFISTGEFIKIQLQNDKNLPGSREYKNMIDCTQKLLKYRVLHRGMMATSMRLIPGWGVYLLVYDAFNRYYDKQAVLGNNETLGSLSVTMRVLISGTLAGWGAWITSYPFDYIKTQIQAHPITKWNTAHNMMHLTNPPRIRDVALLTMQKYGLRGFYRGLIPCLIRSFPVNTTNFWVYESVLQIRKGRRAKYD